MKALSILAALVLATPTASFAGHPRVIVSAGVYPGCYGYRPYYNPYPYYVARPVYPAMRYYDADVTIEADVQRALRRLGYYRGSIDGDVGPRTRSAIREFQADSGLRPTGRIDGSLLRALGV